MTTPYFPPLVPGSPEALALYQVLSGHRVVELYGVRDCVIAASDLAARIHMYSWLGVITTDPYVDDDLYQHRGIDVDFPRLVQRQRSVEIVRITDDREAHCPGTAVGERPRLATNALAEGDIIVFVSQRPLSHVALGFSPESLSPLQLGLDIPVDVLLAVADSAAHHTA